MKRPFKGRIVVLGCGGIARCVLPLLPKHLDISPTQITIIDFADNRSKVSDILQQGAKYVLQKITRENLASTLSQYLQPNDLLIDLAWNIACTDILTWCNQNQVMYINTAMEVWDPYNKALSPTERTLYHRHMELRQVTKSWDKENAPTAILDHGANPGLVSHFARQGLIDLATSMIEQTTDLTLRSALEQAVADEDFPRLGYLTQTKVIHISERDTQIVNQPRRVNEFVNTWSVEGLYEEGIAPAELGWGSHEQQLPPLAHTHKEGPGNQICLDKMGIHTKVQSWVPSGDIVGMVVRHGEAFSLSEFLTLKENGKVQYRPTVHYAYCPSDNAIASLHELVMRNYDLQKEQRILQDEIIDGHDELGTLLLGNPLHNWWTGTVLDIHAARKLVPGQNATTVQVAAAILSAIVWMLQNPNKGIVLPEQLPYKEILNYAKPYLGQVISMPTTWRPRMPANVAPQEMYQFKHFLVD